MIWKKILSFLQDLDKRVTDNIVARGERWVHDPDDKLPERQPGARKVPALVDDRADARPSEQTGDANGKSALWQRKIA